MTKKSMKDECLELTRHVEDLKNRIADRIETREKIDHLNAVLSSIRAVNRLIIKERDRNRLIQGICESLNENRGFHNAWIVLMDEDRRITASAQAGLGSDFKKILDAVQGGRPPVCCRSVMGERNFLSISNPADVCRDCAVSHMYRGRGALSARLEYGGVAFGMLTVSTPPGFSDDVAEQEMFRDVADDIAYALYAIDMEADRRKMVAALQEAHDQLETRVRQRTEALEKLSARIISAQEEERKRIAGDLHDGIGQCISAVKFMVETAIEKLSGKAGERDLQSLRALIPLLQETSEEVRTITMNLRPTILDDMGVIATLNWFCRQFRSVYSHIHLDVDVSVAENDVPDMLKIILFRIVQEAMNNIAKHSQADRAAIRLTRSHHILSLSVSDNGIGMDPAFGASNRAASELFGIVGMKERTELSGGRFAIETDPAGGCRVKAEWDCVCAPIPRG